MKHKVAEPPRQPPTVAEDWYLRSLKIWMADRGDPPTVRELASWLGRSHTAAHRALRALLEKGWVVQRDDRRFVAAEEV